MLRIGRTEGSKQRPEISENVRQAAASVPVRK